MEISYDGLVAQNALHAAAKLGVADALWGKLQDLEMLVLFASRERTEGGKAGC
jgi:hypothetical protein